MMLHRDAGWHADRLGRRTVPSIHQAPDDPVPQPRHALRPLLLCNAGHIQQPLRGALPALRAHAHSLGEPSSPHQDAITLAWHRPHDKGRQAVWNKALCLSPGQPLPVLRLQRRRVVRLHAHNPPFHDAMCSWLSGSQHAVHHPAVRRQVAKACNAGGGQGKRTLNPKIPTSACSRRCENSSGLR